jgi:hypothetical protein
MRFAKRFEQNWKLEVFRFAKVVRRSSRPVYEQVDLRGKQIEGQFYAEELVPVRVNRRTEYLVDKILDTRVSKGIGEHLVRWRGYGPAFDSWIPASNTTMRHYMTLLSDASLSVFPDNSLSRFRVRMVMSVNLSAGTWEVGLCELIYPEPSSGTELQPIFVYSDLIEPQRARGRFASPMSPDRQISGSRRASRFSERAISACGKGRVSNRRHRGHG